MLARRPPPAAALRPEVRERAGAGPKAPSLLRRCSFFGPWPCWRRAISEGSRTSGWLAIALFALAAGLWLAGRIDAVFSVAFNWDEFVLFDRSARSLADGVLRGGGHGGLSELIITPFVSECDDEIAVGRHARLVWLGFFVVYLGGVAVLLRELLRDRPQREHDAALGVAVLALLPVVVEWSLQVRTDHLAAAGGAWGGALLLMSRRRLWLAALAGLAFGLGWLSSQKLAYLALLMLCLEVGTLALTRDWQARREGLRAVLLASVVLAVTAAYRAGVAAIFDVPVTHPTSPVPQSAWVTSYLDIFDFYRHTLGYDQHIAVLPTLLPHALVFLGLGVATLLTLREHRLDVRVPLAWGSLLLGIGVALFHAAAFSYFWITLGTFLAVAFALALGPARERLPNRFRAPAMALLWCAIVAPGIVKSASLLEDSQAVQRESLRFVESNFRGQDPGFHPEAGVFCSAQPMGTWLSQSIYQRVGAPDARANIPHVIERFKAARIHYLVQSFRLNQFPPEIRRFFADHYQPYRGSVFVAGRQLAGEAGEAVAFELILPGV
jgi:hypothetical protein